MFLRMQPSILNFMVGFNQSNKLRTGEAAFIENSLTQAQIYTDQPEHYHRQLGTYRRFVCAPFVSYPDEQGALLMR